MEGAERLFVVAQWQGIAKRVQAGRTIGKEQMTIENKPVRTEVKTLKLYFLSFLIIGLIKGNLQRVLFNVKYSNEGGGLNLETFYLFFGRLEGASFSTIIMIIGWSGFFIIRYYVMA